MARILVIDNYDSFVYTIVGYLRQMGADTAVARNDAPHEPADARSARAACRGEDQHLPANGPAYTGRAS